MKTNIIVTESKKEIFLIDKTDLHNEPRGYNRKVRGFKKVADYINANMERLCEMTMYSVITELETIADLNFRTYYAMD